MNHSYNPKQELRKLKQVPVSSAFLASLRTKLVAHMSAHPFHTQTPEILNTGFAHTWARYRISFAVGVVVIVLVLGSGGAVALAKNSLPGDVLYPVKLLAERIQLNAVSSPENRVQKNIEFAQRRIEEVGALATRHTDASTKTHVQDALQNIVTQLQQINTTAQTLKESGDDQKSARAEDQLKHAADSYIMQLQTIGDEDHREIKTEIQKSVELLKTFSTENDTHKDTRDTEGKDKKSTHKDQKNYQSPEKISGEQQNSIPQTEIKTNENNIVSSSTELTQPVMNQESQQTPPQGTPITSPQITPEGKSSSDLQKQERINIEKQNEQREN